MKLEYTRSNRLVITFMLIFALLLSATSFLKINEQVAHAQSVCSSLPTDKGKATYTTSSSPASGSYNIWSRVKSPDGAPTFLLSLDGPGGSLCEQNVTASGGANAWIWVKNTAKLSWSGGGNITLQAAGNKNDVGLDCIVLTTDNSFAPSTKDDCVTPDTDAPTVSLTAPANNASVSGAVSMTANASDNTGVTKVEFLVDGNVIATDTTSPYATSWSSTGVGNGAHTLTARAYDAANNNATSSNVQVTVNNNVTTNLEVKKASQAPNVDGNVDSVWSEASAAKTLDNVIVGTVTNANDLSGNFRTLWTDTHLYVLADIKDDIEQNDTSGSNYDDDVVEVFLDMNNSKSTSVQSDDYHYYVRRATAAITESFHNATSGVTAAKANTTGGYRIELAIPWSTVGYSPAQDNNIGFDIHVDDDDDGGTRDSKISWFDTQDIGYTNPSVYGTATLKPASGGGGGNPPEVSITTPNNTRVQNNSVNLQVDASDDNAVSKVEFHINGSSVHTKTSAPYTFSWNVRDNTSTNGNYTFTAVAFDSDDNSTTSSPITVKVRHPDINRNDKVDILDLAAILGRWNQASNELDLNDNGRVDIIDLSLLLSRWGT